MFSFWKPDRARIDGLLRECRKEPTYLGNPDGFVVDHNRILLGVDCFDEARLRIREWRMFDIGWVELCWPSAPIRTGEVVAPLISVLGVLWSLSPARIASVIDEPRRFGFTYVTLPDHEECGEERFLVEWLPNGEVWYDIHAVSRPRHWLARLGYPAVRWMQRRFARHSLRAMQRATR